MNELSSYQAWVSIRVVRSTAIDRRQKALQLILIWLFAGVRFGRSAFDAHQ
jgi:hypothetical protein